MSKLLYLFFSFFLWTSLLAGNQSNGTDWDSWQLEWKKPYPLDTLNLILKHATKPGLLAEASLHKATVLFSMTKAEEMMPLLLTATQYARNSGDQLMLSRALNLHGLYYYMLNMHEKALEYLLKNLDIAETLDNQDELIKAYSNLAMALAAAEDFDQSLFYHRKVLKLHANEKASRTQVTALYNISSLLEAQEEYDSVIHYCSKGLAISLSLKDSIGVVLSGRGLSKAWLELKHLDSAKYYINFSEPWLPQYYGLLKAYHYNIKSDIALAEKDYATAITLAKKADHSIPPDTYRQTHFNSKRRLHDLYELTNNYPLAIQYLKACNVIRDSIFSMENQNKIKTLRVAYEAEKKEAAIAQLEQENQIANLRLRQSLYIGLSLVLLSLLLAGGYYLFSRQRLLKIKQNQLEIEQQLQRARLNPHFIFNALGAIREVLRTKDVEQAERYLMNFSKMMRSMLEFTSEEFISLEEELEFIQRYLELQQLRFSDQFTFSIQTDVEDTGFLVPAMITQPIVENAVEHGMKNQSKGHIIVKALSGNGVCKIIVSNDQAQRTEWVQTTERKSFGLDITKKRLAYLSSHLGRSFQLNGPEIRNGHTEVAFELAEVQ